MQAVQTIKGTLSGSEAVPPARLTDGAQSRVACRRCKMYFDAFAASVPDAPVYAYEFNDRMHHITFRNAEFTPSPRIQSTFNPLSAVHGAFSVSSSSRRLAKMTAPLEARSRWTNFAKTKSNDRATCRAAVPTPGRCAEYPVQNYQLFDVHELAIRANTIATFGTTSSSTN